MAVYLVDAHYTKMGFRRTAILRKVVIPFLGVNKTKFYEVVKNPPHVEKNENIQILLTFAISIGDQRLKKRDLA